MDGPQINLILLQYIYC